MSNPLEQLIGQRVIALGIVHDYTQVTFGNAATLTINNEFTITDDKSLTELTGLALTGASQSADEVVLTFQDGTTLNVNLKPDAYRGPEAMVLHQEGQPIVVWN